MRALLATAKFELLIHGARSVEEARVMDLGEIYQRTRREVTGLCGLDRDGGSEGWGAEHAKSEHLFQGYEAGYYSYVV
jgi:metallopeptidase MepB